MSSRKQATLDMCLPLLVKFDTNKKRANVPQSTQKKRQTRAVHSVFLSKFIAFIMEQIQSILQNQILKAAEEQLDAEIERLDNLTEDDLEQIRNKRIQEMKTRQQQMQQWKINVFMIHFTSLIIPLKLT
jgi:hypothetical protein